MPEIVYFRYYPVFSEMTNSATAGLLLSLLYEWNQSLKLDEGWFSKAYEDIYRLTFLTRREWETGRKILISFGLIETKRRGLAPALWYKLNTNLIHELLS
jgi:hypothetical protein